MFCVLCFVWWVCFIFILRFDCSFGLIGVWVVLLVVLIMSFGRVYDLGFDVFWFLVELWSCD